MEQAREAESQGNFDAAVVSLERAMRIQPRDPEILQAMAEVQLHKRDYEQALNFAVRSYDSGSRVGELCARNWHTIAVSRERLGDNRGADEAKARAGTCMNTKPQSY
jgi:Tfp pilus assembly protein PilF